MDEQKPVVDRTLAEMQQAASAKKTWVTPSATIEQVSDVTKNLGGLGFDAINCQS